MKAKSFEALSPAAQAWVLCKVGREFSKLTWTFMDWFKRRRIMPHKMNFDREELMKVLADIEGCVAELWWFMEPENFEDALKEFEEGGDDGRPKNAGG